MRTRPPWGALKMEARVRRALSKSHPSKAPHPKMARARLTHLRAREARGPGRPSIARPAWRSLWSRKSLGEETQREVRGQGRRRQNIVLTLQAPAQRDTTA